MKNVFIFILSLFLVGCGIDSPNRMSITPTNEELKPYLDDFIAMAKINEYDTSRFNYIELGMTFGQLEGTTIGLCRTNYSQSQVTIDRDFWNNSFEVDKRALIFHELGHCLLFKGHEGEKISINLINPDGTPITQMRPSSIMNPILISLLYPNISIPYLSQVLMPDYYIPQLFKTAGVPISSDNSLNNYETEILEFRETLEDFNGH